MILKLHYRHASNISLAMSANRNHTIVHLFLSNDQHIRNFFHLCIAYLPTDLDWVHELIWALTSVGNVLQQQIDAALKRNREIAKRADIKVE